MSTLIHTRHPGINLGHTDPEVHREAEETLFGFWIFLMSDLVLFALLFATYASMLGRPTGGRGRRTFSNYRAPPWKPRSFSCRA